MDKDILLSLVKRDDLDIEEIAIWKYLVKWGTAQFAVFKGSIRWISYSQSIAFKESNQKQEDYDLDLLFQEPVPEPSKGKSQKVDVAEWTDNDFASLKKSLDPFIPYIRFNEISNEEFYHHVRSYKK